MLQALNILENFDLKSMGYNSARYIHTLYQAMSLAFADRDFYYGDPDFPPVEPVRGLLSKEYARERAKLINAAQNVPTIAPGDPYPYQGEKNPYADLLKNWGSTTGVTGRGRAAQLTAFDRRAFYAGTTSVEAADEEGWVVSVTPSGGWMPAVIAGHTGIGMSQRMQSFVLDPAENPFNVDRAGQASARDADADAGAERRQAVPLVLGPGRRHAGSEPAAVLPQRRRVRDDGAGGHRGGELQQLPDAQLVRRITSRARPDSAERATPPWVRASLRRMGYTRSFEDRTSGPINAIMFDRTHGTMWGGSSNHGEDYGIGW